LWCYSHQRAKKDKVGLAYHKYNTSFIRYDNTARQQSQLYTERLLQKHKYNSL
jgi:hypothetical protein